MKVVHLASSAQLGGAERVVLDIIAGLRSARPDWTSALVAPAPGPLVDRARSLGIDVSIVPLPDALARLGDAGLAAGGRHPLALLRRVGVGVPHVGRYIVSLARTLRALRPTLVHAHGF